MRIERQRWDGQDPRAFAREVRAAADPETATAAGVAATIAAVRSGGDRAVLELSRRFDGVAPRSLRVPDDAIEAALAATGPDLSAAIERSADAVRAVAEAQAPAAARVALAGVGSVTLTEVPVGSAGIYAPGGRSPYPSSLLMGVVPARVAGVRRVVAVSPPRSDGLPHPSVLAAARIAGADEVYAMGGAQAIAALAHGTESVAAVDVIAGPGSPWVQEAKLACSRTVGIDGYAGPSELMVLCDSTADAAWVALDLCAQGEHGDDGVLVAASADEDVLDGVASQLKRFAAERPSVRDTPVHLIRLPELERGLALAEALAPEHLELACEGAEALAAAATTAGCVFIGRHAAAAFGDYSAGSNHVLPTGGAGRFSGPLGPGTFRRRISRVVIDEAAAAAMADDVHLLASAEGFPVHGESARVRASGPSRQAS